MLSWSRRNHRRCRSARRRAPVSSASPYRTANRRRADRGAQARDPELVRRGCGVAAARVEDGRGEQHVGRTGSAAAKREIVELVRERGDEPPVRRPGARRSASRRSTSEASTAAARNRVSAIPGLAMAPRRGLRRGRSLRAAALTGRRADPATCPSARRTMIVPRRTRVRPGAEPLVPVGGEQLEQRPADAGRAVRQPTQRPRLAGDPPAPSAARHGRARDQRLPGRRRLVDQARLVEEVGEGQLREERAGASGDHVGRRPAPRRAAPRPAGCARPRAAPRRRGAPPRARRPTPRRASRRGTRLAGPAAARAHALPHAAGRRARCGAHRARRSLPPARTGRGRRLRCRHRASVRGPGTRARAGTYRSRPPSSCSGRRATPRRR